MFKDEITKIGIEKSKIDVRISYRIIQLFSEGLYSSAQKAVEELVSNSFDAGAKKVHIVLSPFLGNDEATIVVIDDGEGMDEEGLKQHWLIGVSNRRNTARVKFGRKPIGKFGIGKLATYVLANKLSHICKSNGNYFATSMDYTKIDPDDSRGIYSEKVIELPLRVLKEEEAKNILAPWITGKKPGYKDIRLFGKNSVKSWTVAIMSDLKTMGQNIQQGRLKWVLRTAMPLRDDFVLYMNGEKLESSKVDIPTICKSVLGKDIKELPNPAPDDLTPIENEAEKKDSIHRFSLTHNKLGNINGYIEIYDQNLIGGKSDEIERSNGFFVYVRERLINIDEPGFGINRNLLRHGTFSRFRMVVHIDQLDEELRSSRESIRQGELYKISQNFLHGAFNYARNKLQEYEKAQTPGAKMAVRIAKAPGSMIRKPLLNLIIAALKRKFNPIYLSYPRELSTKDKNYLLEKINVRSKSPDGLVQGSEIVTLSGREGIAVYDVESGKLQINAFHPFVASFLDIFTNKKTSLPLEMLAILEILIEAYLYELNLEEGVIHDIMEKRDELLRELVRSTKHRNAYMISLDLLDAKNDANQLEEELRATFDAMGFSNVIRLGGPRKPDGIAEAHLAASEEGQMQRYKVLLEAKSGEKVSAKTLDVSGIGRQMRENGCDHAIVIGNKFATSTGEDSASVNEINNFKESTKRESEKMEEKL